MSCSSVIVLVLGKVSLIQPLSTKTAPRATAVDLDILENFLKDHPEVVKRLEETRRRENEK